MKNNLKSKIAVFVCIIALWVSSMACGDGEGIMSNDSQAKLAYDYAECVRDAGDDWYAVEQCGK